MGQGDKGLGIFIIMKNRQAEIKYIRGQQSTPCQLPKHCPRTQVTQRYRHTQHRNVSALTVTSAAAFHSDFPSYAYLLTWYICAYTRVLTRVSQLNFWESVLFFHHIGSGIKRSLMGLVARAFTHGAIMVALNLYHRLGCV